MPKSDSVIHNVSIILPTYNEAENIIPLIEEINRVVTFPHEIIVVDDDSPDGTSKLVASFQKKNKSVTLLTRRENRGLTNSIKDGITRAKGDVIVWMDCDFSMPPFVINQLLEKLTQGYDIVVGSRFIKGGKFKQVTEGEKDSPLAVMLSRGMNMCIRMLLNQNFYDYTSGFVAARAYIFEKVHLRGDYGEYFIDLIYKAFANKFRITEIPYVCLPRERGESKTGSNLKDYLKRGSKYIVLTVQLLWERHVLHTIP